MAYDRKIPVHIDYPLRLTLSMIQAKWRGCIINILRTGEPLRLNEIHRLLHMAAPRVINIQLRAMINDGLIIKENYGGIPPCTEYRLSELGLSLVPVIDVLKVWGTDNRKYFGS